MKKNIGFIGCGKMASAIINAIKDNQNIIGSEINTDVANTVSKNLGIPITTDNKELAQKSEIIFISTKPNNVNEVINELKEIITPEKLIVSIAAGVKTEKIESVLEKVRLIRVMPNTPALVKLGMFGICKGKHATQQDLEFVFNLLSGIGKCIEVEESQMDIVTAISGSGPAFFYQIIEDMARAGEKLGLEYEKSLILATQTALGSAQMIFNRGETPMQTLINNVATKGGCTYEGINEMNIQNSTKLFFDVIEKTVKKASELGK